MIDYFALGAYRKRPLTEIYSSVHEVPVEFIMQWYEETERIGDLPTDAELIRMASATPEERMAWLAEALEFQWAVIRSLHPELFLKEEMSSSPSRGEAGWGWRQE